MYHHWDNHHFVGLHFIWWILLVLLIILIVYLFYKKGGGNGKQSDQSLNVLRERFARGEISEEEYLARKKRLTDDK